MVSKMDAEVGGPLLASGKATLEGEAVAVRYKQLRDLIDTLEDEREALREMILAAADEFPGVKSFPAGDVVIRIGTSSRETVASAKVRTERPDLYDALTAGGFVHKSTNRTLSIK